jgi:parvulin-like peptidyl-prolyl isomerase
MLNGATRGRLGALLLATLACGDGGDPWIAEVDGEKIRLSELQASLEPRSKDDPEAPRRDLLYEELDRLVSERVVLARAQALGLAVSDEEVESRLQALFGDQTFLADKEYREKVRRQILLDRTALSELAAKLQISENDILLHFEEHQERFARPERAHVRQLVVQERALARRLLTEARSGADFPELAREWSIGPEAEDGGLLPPFARGEMPEAFDRVFELRAGALSDVIESPFGFHVFRLERKIPASEASLEEASAQIRAELQQRRLRELRPSWERELRAQADIRVNEPLLESYE